MTANADGISSGGEENVLELVETAAQIPFLWGCGKSLHRLFFFFNSVVFSYTLKKICT